MIIPPATANDQLPDCDYEECRKRALWRCEKCRYWLCGVHSHRGTPSGWVCDPYCL